MQTKTIGLAIALVSSAVLLGESCTHCPAVTTKDTLHVQTHVAVVMVSQWEDQAEDLAPEFSLTAKQALDQVLPETATYSSALGRSLSGKIGISLDLPGASPQPTGAAPDAGAGVAASSLVHPLGVDPMMKYAAATALFQEVQLLSRYVANAAMRRNFVPYLVRFQVATLPLGRDNDVDVLVSLQLPKEFYVVPILLSDDLERTYVENAFQQINALSVGLGVVGKAVGFDAEMAAKFSAARNAMGEALNSLFLVTISDPHTLVVRRGAQNSGSRRTLQPRSHFLSALVLVPKENATNYEDLAPMDDKVTNARLDYVKAESAEEVAAKAAVLEKVTRARQRRYDEMGLQKVTVKPRVEYFNSTGAQVDTRDEPPLEFAVPPYHDQAFRNCIGVARGSKVVDGERMADCEIREWATL